MTSNQMTTSSNYLNNSSSNNMKGKKYNPNHTTTTSMITKSLSKSINKTPSKKLNKKIIDSFNNASGSALNTLTTNNNNIKCNQTYQHNFNHMHYDPEEIEVLNQELHSSNNIIFSLNHIISSLNQKVEHMEQNNMNLTEYYKKSLSNLQSENADMKKEINEIIKAQNEDVFAELKLVTEEENRMKDILKDKEEEVKCVEEELNAVLDNIARQQDELPDLNSYYQSILRQKEKQIAYLTELSKGNIIIVNEGNYLMPQKQIESIEMLLLVQLSLIPDIAQNKENIIDYLIEDTYINPEDNDTYPKLTCSCIAKRLIDKMTPNSKNNDLVNEKVEGYLMAALFKDNQSYCDIDSVKKQMYYLMKPITIVTQGDYSKYSKSLSFIFNKTKLKRLEELLQSKDAQKKGIITYNDFIDILQTMKVIYTEDQYIFMIYIMKYNSEMELTLFELYYLNLLSFLNPKPKQKIDNYISRIQNYLKNENCSINSFMSHLTNKIKLISEQKYVENDKMDNYLKEKGILNDNEELDKDNTPELINIDFLVNLFEQDSSNTPLNLPSNINQIAHDINEELPLEQE